MVGSLTQSARAASPAEIRGTSYDVTRPLSQTRLTAGRFEGYGYVKRTWRTVPPEQAHRAGHSESV